MSSSISSITVISTSGNRSMKIKAVAVVTAMAFLALVASKIAVAMNGQKSEHDHRYGITTTTTITENDNDNDNDYALNHADYFTSIEAEFEWNKFMVPGEWNDESQEIDPSRKIERNRDTGRKLVSPAEGLRSMNAGHGLRGLP